MDLFLFSRIVPVMVSTPPSLLHLQVNSTSKYNSNQMFQGPHINNVYTTVPATFGIKFTAMEADTSSTHVEFT